MGWVADLKNHHEIRDSCLSTYIFKNTNLRKRRSNFCVLPFFDIVRFWRFSKSPQIQLCSYRVSDTVTVNNSVKRILNFWWWMRIIYVYGNQPSGDRCREFHQSPLKIVDPDIQTGICFFMSESPRGSSSRAFSLYMDKGIRLWTYVPAWTEEW